MDLLEPTGVARLVEGALEAPATSITEVAGSVTNRSYRVETSVGSVAVKSCSEADWINETTALSTLSSASAVPVAGLVTAGHLETLPYLILQWVDGAPASSAPARRDAGVAVRELHRQVANHSGPPSDPAPSWTEVLHRGLGDELADVVSAGLLSAADASQVRRAVSAIPPYLGEPRWLHGDVKDVHLHSRGDALVALLDWGDASAGDPVYDLARYSLEGRDAFRALLDGYGPVEIAPEALRGYRLRFTIGCLATELRAEGDWFETYQARIAADLHGPTNWSTGHAFWQIQQ